MDINSYQSDRDIITDINIDNVYGFKYRFYFYFSEILDQSVSTGNNKKVFQPLPSGLSEKGEQNILS